MSLIDRSTVSAVVVLTFSCLVAGGCADNTDVPATGPGTGGAAGSTAAGGASATGGASGTTGKGGSAGKGGAGGAGASGTAGSAGKGAAGMGGASGSAAGGSAGAAGSSAGAAGAAGGKAGSGGAAAGAGGAGKAGAGGGGASGGGGSAGAGGAPVLPCLPAASVSSLLTLDASFPFCVVRANTTSQAISFAAPSWGVHGGPLTSVASGSSVTLTRWTLPTGATDAAIGASVTLLPPGLPSGSVFWGPVVDLPFEGWTLLSYTTTASTFAGEVLATDHGFTSVKSRGAVDGFFSGVALTDGAGKERLVYSGLSEIAQSAPATTANGLWTADVCSGSLVPSAACTPGAKLASWQSSSGPVAADTAGNVFAMMSTFGGDEELRGFTKADALGAVAVTGAMLATDKNYTTSMAAIAPSATDDGWVFVAEANPADQSPKPVFGARFAITGGALVAKGAVASTFTLATAGASAAMFSDDAGQLWLAIDTGQSTGALVALRRK